MFFFLCQRFYKIFKISRSITLVSFLSEIKIVAILNLEKKKKKKKKKTEAHGPQRSPECTAMKA